jgi:Secretion system C-terminal sorting domain
MKLKLLIIIFLSTLSLMGKAQNLISNPSFEAIGTPAFPFPTLPWLPSMLAAADNWWSLAKVGGTCDGSNLVFSTPDLWKVGTFTIHWQGISGHTGNTYAGMGPGEIIQQKLPDPLALGRYKLKLFIRGRGSSLGLVNPHFVQSSNCEFSAVARAKEVSGIRVFASSDKIEYDPSDVGLNGGLESDVKINNLQPIKFITAPNEANSAWTEVSTEFFVENPNIKWIGIEGAFTDIAYTFVDDISLEKVACNTCTDACNPESGCIEAGIAYTNTCNLEVVKLGNVSSVDMTVTSVNGGIQYRSIHIDHPPCRVRYDGRNQAGVDLAAGTYVLNVKVKNGCDIIALPAKQFSKFGSWTGVDCLLDPINYSSLSTTSKINPKLVCCPDNLAVSINTQITDIATTAGGVVKCLAIGEYLSQQSFFNLPALNLKAKQAIVIDPGISSMKNITFTAPKITINGSTANPHTIYPGATFKNAVDCPFGLVADNNPPATFLESSNSNNTFSTISALHNNIAKSDMKMDTDFDTDTSIRLSPNPSNGKFSLEIPNNFNLSNFEVEIVDFLGKKVNSFSKLNSYIEAIDLSNYADGMYIIKITKNNMPFWVSKILKTTN